MFRTAMLLLTLVTVAFLCRAQAPSNNAAIVGQWTASLDGLPGVRLVIQENDSRLTGAILFFLIHRDPGAPPSATAGFPEPLFDLKFDGVRLTFRVNHRFAHAPRTLADPPVSFHLEITGPDQANLFSPEIWPVPMTRVVHP